jgi:hypothetical protein
MFTPVRKFVVYCWNFVFNHEVSPLRNIPDVAIRHYVLQALGFMWAVAFLRWRLEVTPSWPLA